MRLTGPNVSKLSLPDGKSEMIVFDDALPGFGVRMRSGGKRVWVAQYRVGSKQRRVTIGNVEAIGADRARAAAKDILAKVQLGDDPQSVKAAERKRAATTTGSVAELYLAGPAKSRLRDRSYHEVDRHLRVHWKPLCDIPIHLVTRSDIATRLNTIARDSGPFAANRARATLSALFGWAMREGIVEANPVIGTNKATAEVSRDRVLSDDELRLIWQLCGSADYGRIVRLLILTGQRREEVAGMRWSELDLAKAAWSLPKERTKNSLPHDVPLSPAAVDILAGVPKREGRDLVFGEGEGPFSGWSKAKIALDARVAKERTQDTDASTARGANEVSKHVAPWRLHDIRRTVATRLGDLGVLPHVVEAVLNHVSGHRAGVAGIYNRAAYAKEKREALETWGAAVQRAAKEEALAHE
ncbi:tyrosine-type recombinase/integrase [Aurantimonas sp. A3-2-R12]|uniref:tyrosine-type recombinase/integrase n=1 Tax=Aurantimonas sp. A3-2-R12 TaxID=3114362 RepID=UPI002E17F1CA|nr:tyrosine-type recombinase/integrase [Aurantimonas sp. A3-2-R12]